MPVNNLAIKFIDKRNRRQTPCSFKLNKLLFTSECEKHNGLEQLSELVFLVKHYQCYNTFKVAQVIQPISHQNMAATTELGSYLYIFQAEVS